MPARSTPGLAAWRLAFSWQDMRLGGPCVRAVVERRAVVASAPPRAPSQVRPVMPARTVVWESRTGRAPEREEAGMIRTDDVHEGMTVRTATGRVIGRVAGIGDTHFELEQGLVPIPRRDYLVEFSDVDFIRGHDVYLVNADHPLLVLEVDDDGGALPPRHSEGLEREPVNVDVES
ncbi:hypothetical protein QEG98_40415 [Myxococcus sp. MxC21-1]|uniref:hypothetical protein n=1 Tax=Myxococcus sp. MxC21-1 TaxID=3041439 RepID=UPI00292CDDC3|nr:hypothetical protein [Myxococcus sp. MxC21-1]WNZ62020.1 hypothetical protein QEG98_40415 [Myxococcus sp. MxC21-1]